MTIDSPELERLVDEVAGMAGESRTEAVRRALEERRDRLARERMPPADVAARLAALSALQDSLALTPEQADAWIADIAAERRANHPRGAAG